VPCWMRPGQPTTTKPPVPDRVKLLRSATGQRRTIEDGSNSQSSGWRRRSAMASWTVNTGVAVMVALVAVGVQTATTVPRSAAHDPLEEPTGLPPAPGSPLHG
jgi:hypothetical protein